MEGGKKPAGKGNGGGSEGEKRERKKNEKQNQTSENFVGGPRRLTGRPATLFGPIGCEPPKRLEVFPFFFFLVFIRQKRKV